MDRLPNSLPITEPICRRGEVLTGPERRRRWGLEEKARIVADCLAPGAVAGVVARRYGVHPNQLYGWRWELRLAAVPSGVADFVPVAVAPVAASSATVKSPRGASSATLALNPDPWFRRVLLIVPGPFSQCRDQNQSQPACPVIGAQLTLRGFDTPSLPAQGGDAHPGFATGTGTIPVSGARPDT